MRTAATAIACLLAGIATAGAAEPALELGAPPLPLPSDKLQSVPPVPSRVRAYAPDQSRDPPPNQPSMKRASAESGRPPRGRICFNQTETREKIAAHRLADPVRALRLGRSEGEALSAKLCRWKPDEFVYEVHVLRRDGRVVRVFMNAQSGEALNGLSASDRDKDRN